jgi:GNAT superfamily N-acetyltransferase
MAAMTTIAGAAPARMKSTITIQPATEADVPVIREFIRGLAEYEKLTHHFVATEEDLRRTLFGARPYAEVLIARNADEPVGFALFFHSYSTFLAQPGIWLEDLFVLPAMRSRGIGKALLRAVAKIARERQCGRMEWSVLDWNEPAIAFYRRVGADIKPDWRICRLSAQGIDKLAAEE